MQSYKVMAANFHGVYRAGVSVCENEWQAIDQAKERYRRSAGYMNDADAFRWYVVREWPDVDPNSPSEY